MKRYIALLLFCFAAHAVYAENAGYITSVQIIKGTDGQRYIWATHSSTGGTFGAGTNQLWGNFYYPWGDDDVQSSLMYASLIQSLKDHTLTIDATNGYPSDKVISGWTAVVTNWRLVKN